MKCRIRKAAICLALAGGILLGTTPGVYAASPGTESGSGGTSAAVSSTAGSQLTVSSAVAECYIGAFGQTVTDFVVTLSDPSVLGQVQADGFVIENASDFPGNPVETSVESVTVDGNDLILNLSREFQLYKSDGSTPMSLSGKPLVVSYDKDGIKFSFTFSDIVADSGAIDTMQEKSFQGMDYFSYEPEISEQLPLVVFLHGGNLAGLQKKALAAVDALVQPEFQAEHPCFVLAPTSMRHLNGEMGWTIDERAKVVDLIQAYIDTGKVDPDRIYIAGNSMGSGGAINTALEYPDLFAAVMPMSGPLRGIAEDPAMQEQFREQVQNVLDVPFLITIAKSDPVASYEDAQCMYDIMQEMGANVSAKFYEDEELVDSGVIVYTHAADAMAKYDPSLYEWMFAQSRQDVSQGQLVKLENGFYNYYDANGDQVKLDYVMTPSRTLYFFNSQGLGVEVEYRYLSDRVVQIFDNMTDSAFIVIGEDKAAVIDGMNGTIDMEIVAKFFTDKPLTAIATHGHGDHIGGLQNFDEVYVHSGDFELFRAHSDTDLRFNNLSYDNYCLETGSELDFTLVNIREDFIEGNENLVLQPIQDGDTFDLGGLTVECIHVPGHTAGMTAMLIQEDRILITGDAANRYTQVTAYPVEGYLKSLEKLKAREADYDTIYASHGALKSDGTNGTLLTDTVVDELMEGCQGILDGSIEGVAPAPGAPTRWAYAMGPAGRADGKCGNFMYNPEMIYENPGSQPETQPGTPNPEPGATHTVVAGESLWSIAQNYLGSGTHWNAIYEANKDIIRDPNMIFVGQVLKIPV